MSIIEIFRKPLDSRLYVDLIYQSTSQYAMFHPASQLRLGDYGQLDKATGAFIREGNLFNKFPQLLEEMGAPEETYESHRVVFRSRRYGFSWDLNVDASVSGLVDCSLKAGWTYQQDRHAALVMIDPILTEIPYEGSLYEFLIKQKSLKKKTIVTKLYKCTSYASLLTTGEEGKAYFGFHGSVPIPVTVPVSASGGAKVSWEVHGESGMWSTGLYDPGQYRYTPLATLRAIGKKNLKTGFRGRPQTSDKQPNKDLPRQYPPWGELDDDGVDLDEGDKSSLTSEEESEEETEEHGDPINKVGEKLSDMKVLD